jgi:hypothetical protein
MAKGKWKYKNEGDNQFGICYDSGPDRRFLWMGVSGGFQVRLARSICRELNRAGVELVINDKFDPELIRRPSCAQAAKKEG